MFPRSGYYFAALLAVAVFAFWPSYFSRLPAGGTAYMRVHALLMAAWIVLLIAQPSLIRARRNDLHRRLGRISYVLVPLAVVAALLLAHSRFAPLDAAAFAANAAFLYLPLAATLLFGLTYALAVACRGSPALHARFMIGTSLTLIDPIVARILGHRLPPLPDDLLYPLIGYGITDAVLVALLLADRRSPAGRAAFAAMLAVFGLVHVGFFTLAQTGTWLRFASAFRALPLTG
jgi:hypothetical protein